MKSSRHQQGATLFTALVILILLTLLALSVAQVTGLQERMAGLYRADQQAFQLAEENLSRLERALLNNPELCDGGYQTDLPGGWEDGTVTTGNQTENLNFAEPGVSTGAKITTLQGSAKAGQDRTPGSPNCLYFRLSSLRGEVATDPTSVALTQSIYVP